MQYSAAGVSPADISVYDRLVRSNEDVQRWLAAGTHSRELVAMLGETDYELLAPLAREAARRPPDPDTIVYIVPGILGTQLGHTRGTGEPANLLWLDPIDIMSGRLRDLRLDAPGLMTMGALAWSFLPLALRLRCAGYPVLLYEYDWRQDIAALGRQLAARLRAEPARRIHLVAHSMGGLLARVALGKSGLDRVRTLATLGTPHAGTPAALQALRGTYPVVRRLAALDALHDAAQLAVEVFSGFPSLYGMLPHAGPLCAFDPFDITTWPGDGPRPRADLLTAAASLTARLAPLDARCVSIAGAGQRTVTSVRLGDGEFLYTVESAGDGTVPAASAVPDQGACRYFPCEHSALPRSAAVADAVIDVLAGATAPHEAPPPNGPRLEVGDRELNRSWADKVDWKGLGAEDRRRYLNELNLAPPQYYPGPVRVR